MPLLVTIHSKHYPGVDVDVCGATIMFYSPVVREFLLWAGMCVGLRSILCVSIPCRLPFAIVAGLLLLTASLAALFGFLGLRWCAVARLKRVLRAERVGHVAPVLSCAGDDSMRPLPQLSASVQARATARARRS